MILKAENKSSPNLLNRSRPVFFRALETGQFVYDGKIYSASRKTILSIENSILKVFFNKNNILFEIPDLESKQMIFHRCVSDIYDGKYTPVNEKTFLIKFHVNGPRKAYFWKSIFKRIYPTDFD